MTDAVHHIPAATLRGYVAGIFEGHGVPADHAAIVANNLVDADLRGVDSHGVNLVALYCKRLDDGHMATAGEVTTISDEPTTALLDGGLGLGQVAGTLALDLAVTKAKANGIAAVGVRESTHLGALAYYTLRAADQGCIAIAVQNGPPIVPPFGGLTGIFSTNPFSYAVPAGTEYPIVLDMATTAVAGNRIILYRKKNQEIPDWWATDADGNKTTDPHVASLDHLQWFGGYKGYGMAMMVELLSGCLLSSSFGHTELTEGVAHGKARVAKGYLFIVIDIARFTPLETFKGYVDALVADIRSGERAAGVDRLYVPGEIEHLRKAERMATGLPLDAALVDELESLGQPLGLGALA
jgi:LDH2 family malate/lactate/ureidoglycolate dehydrogenase